MKRAFEQELVTIYEQQPVIIVLEDDQRDWVEKVLRANKFKSQTKADANSLL